MKKIFLCLIILIIPTLGVLFFVSGFMIDDNYNQDDVACESEKMNISAYHFRNNHSSALLLCEETVSKEDKHIVIVAIGVLESLRKEVQYLLINESELLHKLLKTIYSLNQNVENPVVTFINYNEEVINYFIVVNGERINRPADPTKESHNFIGWSVQSYDYLFNFESPITRNITLQALFIMDYRIINDISRYAMAANMHIQRTTTYNGENFVEIFSGVIFNAYLHPAGTGVRIQILTTYDAIRIPENHQDRVLIAHDFRQHYASGRHNVNSVIHRCEASNLAVLQAFVAGGNLNNLPRGLGTIERAESNPSLHDPIIMMGQLHLDQRNSITLGRVTNTSLMKSNLGDNAFMSHTALSTSASNGSAILNVNKELVGIQLYTIGNCINSFEKSIAISIETINAFLGTHENPVW